ncbi:MAG: flagellar biosynthesis protein FliQ [Clostridia bacterium]|nr:flagellar biosynthesis protein FliQ [Clostridia bacterium]
MSEGLFIDVFSEAIRTILFLSSPMLLSALLVGLIIAVFQATTQIQEATLAFVPKLIVIFLVLMMAGPWIMQSLFEFTMSIFDKIDLIVR